MIKDSVVCVVCWIKNLISDLFAHACLEILKFSLVLLMAYMFAKGIFYFWENFLQIDYLQEEVQRRQMIEKFVEPVKERNESPVNYPYVVEIPSKLSNDSIKNKKDKKKPVYTPFVPNDDSESDMKLYKSNDDLSEEEQEVQRNQDAGSYAQDEAKKTRF